MGEGVSKRVTKVYFGRLPHSPVLQARSDLRPGSKTSALALKRVEVDLNHNVAWLFIWFHALRYVILLLRRIKLWAEGGKCFKSRLKREKNHLVFHHHYNILTARIKSFF